MSEETKRASDAIKPVLSGVLSAQAYTTLVAIPGVGWIFALPIVSFMTKAFLDKFMAWLVSETAVGLSILWITFEMAYVVGNAEKAKAKLKDMIENPKKYTEAEMEKISEEFDDTTIDLISLEFKRL